MKHVIPASVIEALPQFPVQHLSFSSVKKWHESPALWSRQYVHGIWDFDTSPSAVVGTSVHKGIELALRAYRDDPAYFAKDACLENLQVEALLEFDAQLSGKSDKKVAKVNWGKTGSPEKSKGDVLQCSRNAIAALRDFLPGWKVAAVEVKYQSLESKLLPLPVSSVIDAVFVHEDGKRAIAVDWKTVHSLSDFLDFDPSGLRRMQSGCYYEPARRALDDAGYKDVELTGCIFVEIHRGKGGADGRTFQQLSVPYDNAENSECVQIWAEMARRAITGIYVSFFLPQLAPMPFNLSAEYGGADAFKLLEDEMENEESLLTQHPAA